VRISPKNAATLYALVKENGLENTQVVLTGVSPGGEYKVDRGQTSPRGGFFGRSFGVPYYNGSQGYYEQETIALGMTDDAKSLDRRRGTNDAIENDAIERQMVRENSARINAFLADGLIRLKLNSQTNLRSRRLWVSSTFASAS
jgi:hypothetical protein